MTTRITNINLFEYNKCGKKYVITLENGLIGYFPLKYDRSVPRRSFTRTKQPEFCIFGKMRNFETTKKFVNKKCIIRLRSRKRLLGTG